MKSGPKFRDELLVFFAMNPDEQMSAEDLCVKFGRRRNHVNEALLTAARDGLVQREREGRCYVYSIGPWLKERLATLQPRNLK